MNNPVLDQERAHYLSMRRGSNGKTAALPAWPRPEKDLALISLEVDWVRFSTLNHRTKAEQMRIVEQQQRPDLFSSDPTGPEAQEEQYAILRGQEGFSDLKADLKERGQQQPAVVTADGILINGNRRTAGLRSLYQDDDFQPARYVTCLVLPSDATNAELVDLETELQIAREFKEDYTWVNEALLIEEIFNRENKDWNKVASRMHKPAPEARVQYEKLQQLHQLVALSNGTRHHADFVPNESAFTELAGHIKGKPPEEAASVRSAYFLGILTGVNYRTLRHLRRADASALVRKELSGNVTLAPILSESQKPADDAFDILDDVLGEASADNDSATLAPVLSFFAKQGGRTEVDFGGSKVPLKTLMASVGHAVDDAAEEASNQTQDDTAVTAPTSFLISAIKSMNKAVQALPKARVLDAWKEQEYQLKVTELKALVIKLDAQE
jgi:hypothetical protein